MSEFKKTRSALGYFWREGQPENRWAGQLYIDGFPKAKTIHLDQQFGYAEALTPRRTVFGRIEGNQHISLVGASAAPTTTTINAGGIAHTWTVTGNYLLVSSYKHYDETSSVRRLTFSSGAAERVLGLKANPLFRDMPGRRNSLGAPAVFQKQVGSYFDTAKGVRIRIFRPRIPSTSIEPLSFFAVDFLEGLASSRFGTSF
jgi:ApeA N-terminal domain 1